MIEALSHITFTVRDVERTGQLLRTVFAAEEVYDGAQRNFSISYEKFFLVGGVWVAIMEGEPLPKRSYNHVAFKVSEAEFDDYVCRIKQCGLEIAPCRDRIEGEASSVYFYDYDNHLFELHTGMLHQRLARYSKAEAAEISPEDRCPNSP